MQIQLKELIMIERHVTFNVIPGKEKDFETPFKDAYRIAMSKQPGFVSVALLKEHDKEAVYQMVIRFQSLETAAAWRDSADHKVLSPISRPSIRKARFRFMR